jgi:arylsulfatase A-like enzyme
MMDFSHKLSRSCQISLLLAISTVFWGSVIAAPRPNIILVMADDMGWGDVSYNSNTVSYPNNTTLYPVRAGQPHEDRGWIHTPVMDSMAANGVRFDRFYSTSAVCSPTRFSCLTGRHPVRGGIGGANTGRLDFDETALSEVLSAEGYATAHMGKWHLGILTTERLDGNKGGLPDHFARYSGPWHHSYDTVFATESKVPTYNPYGNFDYDGEMNFTNANLYNDHGTRYWKLPYSGDEISGEGTPVVPDALHTIATNYDTQDYNGDDSQILVNRAIPFMQDAVADNKPFFLVLWFHTPHKPVKDKDDPTASANSQAGLKNSIEGMDAAIGRLRAELDTLGVRGNTMLWLTSDNGPENGIDSPTDESNNEADKIYQRPIRSGRYLDRKGSLYEGGVIVPGILEWPNVITTGSSTDMPAVTTDYYPTILDYLQLTVPNQKPLDGISLRPAIEGTSHTRSKPVIFRLGGDTALRTNQYKLVNQNIGNDVSGELRLYDMVNIAAGEEPEQTPLATASDYTTKSQAIQDLYTSLKAEHDTLLASVNNDTNYIHSSQPTIKLSTDSNTVIAPFTVTATFNESVSQLNANEFVVSNGTPSGLSGSGTTWTVLVTPILNGPVTVDLPSGAVIDVDGNINPSSSQLSVNYTGNSSPSVTLTTLSDPVTSSFVVTATFNEDVTGLIADDFDVTNGTVSGLSGGPATYTVTINPTAAGNVSVSLPASSAEDGDTNGNNASNQLALLYQTGPTPAATLTGVATTTGSYSVSIAFSESVTGLSDSDFAVSNGSASSLSGSGASYSVLITPALDGDVTVTLPANTASTPDDSQGNTVSNALTTLYSTVGGGDGGVIHEATLTVGGGKTVDSDNLVPAHGSNNQDKFNTSDGAPYTSTSFVRGSSNSARKVRAFVNFDLSELAGQPVTAATLAFNGYSLNGSINTHLQVVALASDWVESGDPKPTYSHNSFGSVIDGGDISTGRDANGAKDYSIDITTMVQNWNNGTWPNYGLRFQLSDHSVNNGLGIQPSGEGSISLVVESAPLFITDSFMPDSDEFTIEWNSAAGLTYGIEASPNLTAPWEPIMSVPGSNSSTSSYTIPSATGGLNRRFFRVVYPVPEVAE